MLDQALLEQIAATKARVVLACSGGVDSMVLLALLRQSPVRNKLHVIHIDHQLHANSGQWADFVVDACGSLPVRVEKVLVQDLGQGLESAARDARYQIFEQLLGKDDLLMTAHHLDDQVETFMLRLLRGSSLAGLSGISAWRACGRGQLYRPLLAYDKSALERYAQAHQISWVEDPSNLDVHYDRNFLRQQVLPLIYQRWPSAAQTIERARVSIEQASGEQRQAWSELLQHRLTAQGALKVVNFEQLAESEQYGLLALWLEHHDQQVPSRQFLATLIDQLINARADSQPRLTIAGRCIRRFGSAIFLLPALDSALWPAHTLTPETPLHVPHLGQISLQPAQADGYRPVLNQAALQLANRQGGERLAPPRRAGSRDVKRLLQEYREPPWWRERMPMFYVGEQLAAVGDLAIDQAFAAKAGEMGYLVQWLRPGEF